MILNYSKPVQVSSTLGGYLPNYAVDEDIKTYWSAGTDQPGEWIQTDLGEIADVKAVQINYEDKDADILGKAEGIYHQYKLLASDDGKKWTTILDNSKNKTDVPHDYHAFNKPVAARYIRMENVHMAAGRFAISGLRVFGKGRGVLPDTVKQFIVLRGDSERRNAWLKWQLVDNATGYTIYSGISPDKMYTAVTVFGRNEYYFRAMDKDRPYYFCIESFNKNGIGKKSAVFIAE